MIGKREMERFQVIGASANMQKISWEDVNNLLNGVPYDIDLSQDSPDIFLDGIPIKDISTNDIVKSVNFKVDVGACDRNRYGPKGGDYFVMEFRKLEARERNWRKEKKETEKRRKELMNEYFSFLGVRR